MFAKVESKTEVRPDVEKFPMAASICAFYPTEGLPYVSVQEVEASVAEGKVIDVEPLRNITKEYDPTGKVAIINPETGVPTGTTMTEAEIGAILYSVWVAMRAIPEPEPEELVEPAPPIDIEL